MNTETDPEPYESLFRKLPYEGDFIWQHLFTYVGNHGGFITDGNLKNYYMRTLSDEERHLLAEHMGLKRFVRQDGRIQWNWDLQADQSIETRLRRFSEGYCPIHGLHFHQHSREGYFDDDGVFREEPEQAGPETWCPHCPHCQAKAAVPQKPSVYIAKCEFCPVLAYLERDPVNYKTKLLSLLPEFKYLLESSAPVPPTEPPRRAAVIPFASGRRTVTPTAKADEEAG